MVACYRVILLSCPKLISRVDLGTDKFVVFRFPLGNVGISFIVFYLIKISRPSMTCITLFTFIIMLCGTDSIMQNISIFRLNMRNILHDTISLT